MSARLPHPGARIALPLLAAAALAGAGGGPVPAWAADAAAQLDPHPAAERATVDERPGRALPLEVRLVGEDGGEVRLGRYFRSGRPVLLVPGYYECRMLCSLVLDGLKRALAALPEREAGRDFVVVGVGIDPGEGPAEARARREQVRPGTGWHLLTGPEAEVRRITDALGFGFAYDERTDQYAHPAVVVAASPDGRVSRYVYGVSPAPDTLAAVLAAAGEGRAAASLEQVLVRCFRFSPALQRYAGAVAWFLRVGGAAIVLALAGVFVLAGRRAVREGEAR